MLKRNMPFMYRLVSLVAQPILSAGIQSITNLPGVIVDSVIGSVAEFKIKSFAERYLNPNPPKFFYG
ncbi:MAG TPA: hypothetical protein VFS81_26580, partial [Candidatus Binatia bacterium]|nr:hypothetical protein [Candidatus Binatia bacterium]